jgi:hypothetical protein
MILFTSQKIFLSAVRIGELARFRHFGHRVPHGRGWPGPLSLMLFCRLGDFLRVQRVTPPQFHDAITAKPIPRRWRVYSAMLALGP